MLNSCSFIGNLGADPEIRSLNSGDKVANLRLAVSEKWKDKNTGERKEKTEWVSVVVFGNLVSVIENYVKKGSKLYVSGKLQTRKWQHPDGTDRYSTEVVLQGFDAKLVMLDGKSGGGEGQTVQQERSQQGYGDSRDLDDGIPF